MKPESRKAIALLRTARGLLLDLDGCLWVDGAVLPGSAALLDQFRGRVAIVSNNSTHTPSQVAERFAAQGISIPVSHICLAGELAITHVARRWPGARVMVLAARPICDMAQAAGLCLDDRNPQVIVFARDLELTFGRLQCAARAAARDVPVVAANPDLTHPGPHGVLNLETGSLLAALRAAVPACDVTVIGKPAPALFAAALERLGIDARDALMIGDNPATDIAGAAAAGIAGILVGEHGNAAAPSLENLVHRVRPGDLSTATA